MVSRLSPICHVNLATGYSGGERQTELLVRELGRRGESQRLVVCEASGLVERCGDVPNLESRIVARNGLSAAFATRGCRLVHGHDGRSVYVGLAASLLFGIPYVVTRRVVTAKSMRGLRGLAYQRADAVAAVSEATAKNLRTSGFAGPVTVVWDASSGFKSSADEVAAIRAARPGKLLIGHAGLLDHSAKGQSTIIEVAHRARGTHPDWHFMLCGEGRDRERFVAEIGDLQNVELVGWVDNLGDYLDAFDLFVFPSLKEALGSTLLDAMQFGLPIVATRVGGIPDIVTDGENGRLVEPEDAEGLQAAIEGLLADPDELAAIRTRNVEKSLAFGATPMADAYETLYREITAPM